MQINFLTTQPDFFSSVLSNSILGRAAKENRVTFNVVCLRDFADGNIKKVVDDAPYGGGAGMILKIEPIYRALMTLDAQKIKGQVYLTSAKGPIFNQRFARTWSHLDALTLICGHYEGVDERVLHFVDGEISLGQFVLTGGEAAALVITDAITRLLPGVLHNPDSLNEESFTQDALEYPQYTRPAVFQDLAVPEVLLNGNHAEIATWRKKNSRPL